MAHWRSPRIESANTLLSKLKGINFEDVFEYILIRPVKWPLLLRRIYVVVLPLSLLLHFCAIVLLILASIATDIVRYGIHMWTHRNTDSSTDEYGA